VNYCQRGEKIPTPLLPPRKKDKLCGVHVQPFHGLHANFIPKTICHHFWLKLLTFAKKLGYLLYVHQIIAFVNASENIHLLTKSKALKVSTYY
jgi:hypothetical protein